VLRTLVLDTNELFVDAGARLREWGCVRRWGARLACTYGTAVGGEFWQRAGEQLRATTGTGKVSEVDSL
jgi:hypothetical protein